MDKDINTQNSIAKYEVNGLSLKAKSDKIVAALYMVTDCIADNEPMKFKLRSLGVELTSDVHELVHASAFDRQLVFSDVELAMSEIISLLSIGSIVSLVSEMNYSILNKEISLLMSRMRAWVETGIYTSEQVDLGGGDTPRFTLKQDFFQESKIGDHHSHQPETQTKTFKTPLNKMTTSVPYKMYEKDKINTTQSFNQTHYKVKDSSSKKFDLALKITRRNEILKLIKDKKEVTIKDISSIISNCSEKTIQRELLTLVGQGVLKRIGEKRWSKYMLA